MMAVTVVKRVCECCHVTLYYCAFLEALHFMHNDGECLVLDAGGGHTDSDICVSLYNRTQRLLMAVGGHTLRLLPTVQGERPVISVQVVSQYEENRSRVARPTDLCLHMNGQV